MRYRDLPIIAKIKALAETDTAAAKQLQDQLVLDLFKLPGFQLVLACIQLIEGTAMEALRAGTDPRTERLAGRIEAADAIRRQLVALLPVDVTLSEDEPEEEVESGDVYTSGFNIPLPTTG